MSKRILFHIDVKIHTETTINTLPSTLNYFKDQYIIKYTMLRKHLQTYYPLYTVYNLDCVKTAIRQKITKN